MMWTHIILMWDCVVMAAPKKNPLGTTGETVRENVARYRESQNLTYADLSRRLTELERPIATLGLSRIEKGERRVDVDDLVALAAALRVSPTSLLMPRAEGEDEEVQATAVEPMSALELWDWLTARHYPDYWTDIIDLDLLIRMRPAWSWEDDSRDSREAKALFPWKLEQIRRDLGALPKEEMNELLREAFEASKKSRRGDD